jgi:flagellar motility protein MotE (MotC chaperone)
MNAKNLMWIVAPLALSAGVIWLSAQDSKAAPGDGVRVGELAEKLNEREKAISQRENLVNQQEQRLTTLQSTLDKETTDLAQREKNLQDAMTKLQVLKARPPIEPRLIQVYEKMDPVAGAHALRELAHLNQPVTVSLLAGMQPKKAAGLLDQLSASDAKLAGLLSEQVALSKAQE